VTHNGFRARRSIYPQVLNSEAAVGPFSITVCAVSPTVSFARERMKRVSDSTCTWLWKSSTGTWWVVDPLNKEIDHEPFATVLRRGVVQLRSRMIDRILSRTSADRKPRWCSTNSPANLSRNAADRAALKFGSLKRASLSSMEAAFAFVSR
jgi:hypothetical protein